jgi:hypothetical protein
MNAQMNIKQELIGFVLMNVLKKIFKPESMMLQMMIHLTQVKFPDCNNQKLFDL